MELSHCKRALQRQLIVGHVCDVTVGTLISKNQFCIWRALPKKAKAINAKDRGMKNSGCPFVCAPIKSRPGTLLSGPRYQSETYTISNGLLLPLHTPSARAREGMNNAPERKASKATVSPPIRKRS